MTIAALSQGAAELSLADLRSEGTASLRAAFFAGLALVPRNGLRSSVWRLSNHVQNAEQPDTSSRTVALARPAAFKSLDVGNTYGSLMSIPNVAFIKMRRSAAFVRTLK
jgi:hypothetical protein